jgi:HSP20 family protein
MKYALSTQRKNKVFPSLFDDFVTRGLFEGHNHKFADRAALPAVNIKENEKSFGLELLVPGRIKDDFHIELTDNILSISFEKATSETGTEEFSHQEFTFESFTRKFNLPVDRIDTEKIAATYEAGVLSVKLPKRPEEVKKETSRSIKIS